MAAPSLTYTITNGTTADATQVMQNLNDLLNGITDGTKDLSISALTCAGTLTANGHVNLGNSSADDLTITASLASTLAIKTTNSYDIGSSTIGLRALYFGANSQTVNIKASSSMSETWTLTLPTTNGSSGQALITDGSGVTSWHNLVSGTYTPTVSNGVNTSGHSAGLCNYSQSGLIVHVEGAADFVVTTGASDATIYVTVPVATANFSSASQGRGLGVAVRSGSNVAKGMWGRSVSGAQTIELGLEGGAVSDGQTVSAYFTFSYQVQ